MEVLAADVADVGPFLAVDVCDVALFVVLATKEHWAKLAGEGGCCRLRRGFAEWV